MLGKVSKPQRGGGVLPVKSCDVRGAWEASVHTNGRVVGEARNWLREKGGGPQPHHDHFSGKDPHSGKKETFSGERVICCTTRFLEDIYEIAEGRQCNVPQGNAGKGLSRETSVIGQARAAKRMEGKKESTPRPLCGRGKDALSLDIVREGRIPARGGGRSLRKSEIRRRRVRDVGHRALK